MWGKGLGKLENRRVGDTNDSVGYVVRLGTHRRNADGESTA